MINRSAIPRAVLIQNPGQEHVNACCLINLRSPLPLPVLLSSSPFLALVPPSLFFFSLSPKLVTTMLSFHWYAHGLPSTFLFYPSLPVFPKPDCLMCKAACGAVQRTQHQHFGKPFLSKVPIFLFGQHVKLVIKAVVLKTSSGEYVSNTLRFLYRFPEIVTNSLLFCHLS